MNSLRIKTSFCKAVDVIPEKVIKARTKAGKLGYSVPEECAVKCVIFDMSAVCYENIKFSS